MARLPAAALHQRHGDVPVARRGTMAAAPGRRSRRHSALRVPLAVVGTHDSGSGITSIRQLLY